MTPRETRIVAAASAAPFGLLLVLLLPIAVVGPANVGEAVGAAAVYGVLLGLAAGFVAVDRLQARQCPACTTRVEKAASVCPSCAYDLETRPRYVCDQRHEVFLDPGLCPCGRRLQPLPPARGIAREIIVMLRIGAWLLAFLMGVGIMLRAVG